MKQHSVSFLWDLGSAPEEVQSGVVSAGAPGIFVPLGEMLLKESKRGHHLHSVPGKGALGVVSPLPY